MLSIQDAGARRQGEENREGRRERKVSERRARLKDAIRPRPPPPSPNLEDESVPLRLPRHGAGFTERALGRVDLIKTLQFGTVLGGS